jgi:hypothetical protein
MIILASIPAFSIGYAMVYFIFWFVGTGGTVAALLVWLFSQPKNI